MKNRTQIILAAALILLASGTVAFSSRGEDSGQEVADGMEGHDHSAMASAAGEAQPVTLSADASGRIGVTYARVEKGILEATVRTVGFVTFDETRLASVNPRIEGWVERLLVDFTGAPVQAGQPLMEVYSPALVTAQEELLLARSLLGEAPEGVERPGRERAEALLTAARRRLAYWDIPEEEILALEERGTVSRTMTLRAPAGGIVVEKDVVEGTRIMPGMELYRIADLSTVWVEAEIFEKDLSLVRKGQHGVVTFEAYPGEIFQGFVTYVYPTVSQSTRAGRIRLELRNPDLRIKPGMYAAVELHGAPAQETLLVPRNAVLQTGERSIVFHRMGNGQLHPMEVVTGRSRGDQIQILSGLSEGQTVAASATFLIDAESNMASAMAGMAGMDHSSMDMGGGEASSGTMDHSQHQMEGMPTDTVEEEVDHSGHVMPAMPTDTVRKPDTTQSVDHSQMDHSGHVMPAMPKDTVRKPDTTQSVDHSQMDHSGHAMPAMPKDTVRKPDTTGTGAGFAGGALEGGRGS